MADDEEIVLRLTKVRQLAYAENRDQNPAALFATDGDDDPLAIHRFEVESGDPSYIAMADGNSMVDILCLLAEAFRHWNMRRIPLIAICGKHGNPCGAAIDWHDPKVALLKALQGDTVAVMGGELVTNFPIDDELGQLVLAPPEDLNIGRKNWGLDLIIAHSFSQNAVALLGKREKRRLLSNPELFFLPSLKVGWVFRPVRGGFLRQKAPQFVLTPAQIIHWTGQPLSDRDFENLLIAWAVCWRASSNTVTLAKDQMLIANGCGQQDRIACVRLCLERANRAGHDTKGSVFASDAFFPYAENSKMPNWRLSVIKDLIESAGVQVNNNDRRDVLRLLSMAAGFIAELDNREGPELLIDAGCLGGVVPADGKNLEEVKALFEKAGLSVAFVAAEHRGFAKH